jgi:hypothetical protein
MYDCNFYMLVSTFRWFEDYWGTTSSLFALCCFSKTATNALRKLAESFGVAGESQVSRLSKYKLGSGMEKLTSDCEWTFKGNEHWDLCQIVLTAGNQLSFHYAEFSKRIC